MKPFKIIIYIFPTMQGKYFFCGIFLAFSAFVFGQVNLVSNPGFEQMNNCPSGTAQITLCVGWQAHCGSPDLFNVCAPSNTVGIPLNYVGRQLPASGNSYAGIHVFDSLLSISEQIGANLTSTMVVGTKYYLSMKVSLAEWFTDEFGPIFLPCNNIGMKFSTRSPTLALCQSGYNIAHLNSNAVISDTSKWTVVQGSFIADSAYQYLTIGNFFQKANTTRISWVNGYRSYFYLDDIIVSTDSTILDFTSIHDQQKELQLTVFPNPFTDGVRVQMGNDLMGANYSITDVLGSVIMTGILPDSRLLELTDIAPGTYILNLQQGDKNARKILIKVPGD
jgi:hypothetical protein